MGIEWHHKATSDKPFKTSKFQANGVGLCILKADMLWIIKGSKRNLKHRQIDFWWPYLLHGNVKLEWRGKTDILWPTLKS